MQSKTVSLFALAASCLLAVAAVPGCAAGEEVRIVPTGASSGTEPIGNEAPNDLVVFTSKETFQGDLGGLSGADSKCNTYAKAAGLKGTFRAWLSDSRTDALDRVPEGAGPWRVLTKGQVQGEIAFADRDGWTGYPKVRLEPNELGEGPGVGEIPYTWTGTELGGKGAGCRCLDWTSDANFIAECEEGYGGGIGSRYALQDDDWTNVGDNPCNAQGSLLCFQVP